MSDTAHILIYAAVYYGIGFAWLCSGIFTGWLKLRGDPTVAVLWLTYASAIWPWLLIRMVWDVAHGRNWTDLFK